MLLNSNCNCEHPDIQFDQLPTVFAIANNSGQMLVNVPPVFQVQGQRYVFFHSILCDLQRLSLLDAIVNENALAPDALVLFGAPFKEKQVKRAEAQQLLKQCVIQNTHHLFLFFINVDILSNKIMQNKLLSQAIALMMRPEDDQEIHMLEGTGRRIRMDVLFHDDMRPELQKIILNDCAPEQEKALGSVRAIGSDQLGMPETAIVEKPRVFPAAESAENTLASSMTQQTITNPHYDHPVPQSYKRSVAYLDKTSGLRSQHGLTWTSIVLGVVVVFTLIDFILAIVALAKAGKKQ